MKRKNIENQYFDSKLKNEVEFLENRIAEVVTLSKRTVSKRTVLDFSQDIKTSVSKKKIQCESKYDFNPQNMDILDRKNFQDTETTYLDKFTIIDNLLIKYELLKSEDNGDSNEKNINVNLGMDDSIIDQNNFYEKLNFRENIKYFTLNDINTIKGMRFNEFNHFPLNKLYDNQSLNLNEIQKLCFDYFYKSKENYILCTSKSCGRLIIIEFAIAQILAENFSSSENSLLANKNFKLIYILTNEEKCRNIYDYYNPKLSKLSQEICLFSSYGRRITDLQQKEVLEELIHSNIIFITADYLEIITRKSNKYLQENFFYQRINLLIYDSLHYISDKSEASIAISYEALITRFNFLREKHFIKSRIIACLPRIKNPKQVASFLKIKRKNVLYFPNEFDLQKVDTKINIYDLEINNDLYEKKLLEYLPEIIKQNSKKEKIRNSIIIISSSIENSKRTYEYLKYMYFKEDSLDENKYILNQIKKMSKNKKLKDVIKYGIVDDNLEMSASFRTLIEGLFQRGTGKYYQDKTLCLSLLKGKIKFL